MNIVSLKKITKRVKYHGLEIDMPFDHTALAVDYNGDLWSYSEKPQLIHIEKSAIWAGHNPVHLGYIDLDGTNWKNTLVEYDCNGNQL